MFPAEAASTQQMQQKQSDRKRTVGICSFTEYHLSITPGLDEFMQKKRTGLKIYFLREGE